MFFHAAPRAENKRSWLYRIHPSAIHRPFVHLKSDNLSYNWDQNLPNPSQVHSYLNAVF
jgi:homogentisate 1,2-dioxygenase